MRKKKIKFQKKIRFHRRDKKLISNCMDCRKKLAKNSPHHRRCHTCWVANGKKHKIKINVIR